MLKFSIFTFIYKNMSSVLSLIVRIFWNFSVKPMLWECYHYSSYYLIMIYLSKVYSLKKNLTEPMKNREKTLLVVNLETFQWFWRKSISLTISNQFKRPHLIVVRFFYRLCYIQIMIFIYPMSLWRVYVVYNSNKF